MEQKHHNMESLFERGLISASLIIEAHRQMSEVIGTYHAQELRAIEALWSVYAMDGVMPKEAL
jgi:hypothetical protein